jgi:hypothetical protein
MTKTGFACRPALELRRNLGFALIDTPSMRPAILAGMPGFSATPEPAHRNRGNVILGLFLRSGETADAIHAHLAHPAGARHDADPR